MPYQAFLSLVSLVLLASPLHAAEKERFEFAIVGGKIAQGITLKHKLPLSIGNDYGPITVYLVESRTDTVVLTGTYASASKNHATIQHLIRSSANRVFIDGPALFKSHDHVAAYGKPLDFDWFLANHARVPNIYRGEVEDEETKEKETQFKIGKDDVYSFTRTGVHMGGSNSFWGGMSWGGDFSLGEGASLAQEKAEVALVVEIPTHLADKITISAPEAHKITVATPSDLFDMRVSEGQIEFMAKTAGCGPRFVK